MKKETPKMIDNKDGTYTLTNIEVEGYDYEFYYGVAEFSPAMRSSKLIIKER
jgi:hypothetical protein